MVGELVADRVDGFLSQGEPKRRTGVIGKRHDRRGDALRVVRLVPRELGEPGERPADDLLVPAASVRVRDVYALC